MPSRGDHQDLDGRQVELRTSRTPDGPVMEGASAARLQRLLLRFRQRSEDVGLDYGYVTAPGNPEEYLRAQLAPLGVAVPDELIVWFRSWNGLAVRGRDVLPFEQPRSVEAAVRNNLISGMEDGTLPWQWERRWMSFTGVNVGLACAAGPTPRSPPRVRFLMPGTDGTAPENVGMQVVSMCTPVA